jgi:replicative superfamily II helicase
VQSLSDTNDYQNAIELAKWLEAKCYESNYKPVPVAEYLVHEDKIYSVNSPADSKNGQPLKSLKPTGMIEPSREKSLSAAKYNAVVSLAMETYDAGYGVLVFCSSRNGCQYTAGLIAKATPLPKELPVSVLKKRMDVLDSLRSIVNLELDPVLEQTIPKGVGFHRKCLDYRVRD